MTNRGRLFIGISLATALAVTGCASGSSSGGSASPGGKVQIHAAKMCQAHGGTYNGATQTCAYTPATRSARQNCEQQSGYYDEAAQICSFNP